jgi:hypothetical protein
MGEGGLQTPVAMLGSWIIQKGGLRIKSFNTSDVEPSHSAVSLGRSWSSWLVHPSIFQTSELLAELRAKSVTVVTYTRNLSCCSAVVGQLFVVIEVWEIVVSSRIKRVG